MTYTMHDPFGGLVEVGSLEEARREVAEYIAVTEYSLRKLEAAVDIEDEIFGTFDLVVDHWNHNAAVIEKMENAFLLPQKKEEYRQQAEVVLKMAKAFSKKEAPKSG
jgi:hypothetical protein|tara:strand:- start:1092 stop:1412 length:321 start_codon:yes stop_codon:yes gene_type:complete